MWKCEHCGCSGIAHDLAFCPMCREPGYVATGSGQTADGYAGAVLVGSSQPELTPSPSEGNSAETPSSLGKIRSDGNWGKN